MNYEPIVPVGRDCDCGHPLIWRRNEQRCAVYGRHEPRQYVWVYRNTDAPLTDVVDTLDALNNIRRKKAA